MAHPSLIDGAPFGFPKHRVNMRYTYTMPIPCCWGTPVLSKRNRACNHHLHKIKILQTSHAILSIGRTCISGPGSGECKSTSQDPIQSAQSPMNASTAAKHIPRVFRESVVKHVNQRRRRCTACASVAEVQSRSPHSKNLKRHTLNRPTLTMWFGADKRPPVALSQAESIYKSSMYRT